MGGRREGLELRKKDKETSKEERERLYITK